MESSLDRFIGRCEGYTSNLKQSKVIQFEIHQETEDFVISK